MLQRFLVGRGVTARDQTPTVNFGSVFYKGVLDKIIIIQKTVWLETYSQCHLQRTFFVQENCGLHMYSLFALKMFEA